MLQAVVATRGDENMKLRDIVSYAISVSLIFAIIFAYGKHSTVDALLVTATWILIGLAGVMVVVFSFITFAIRKHERRNDRDLGNFYKALSEMQSSIPKRIFGLFVTAGWLYAFILHEWTVTAVIYFIIVVWTQIFIFLTKDLAKDFFLAQLKGEGLR